MQPPATETPSRHAALSGSNDEIDNPISWEPSRAFLSYAIAALLIGSAVALMVNLFFVPEQMLRNLGPALLALIAITVHQLLARGRVRVALNVLTHGAWITVTGIALLTGGVRAPVVIVYPAIIIIAGWLIGARMAFMLAGLTFLATLGFVLAESGGILPTPLYTPPAMHGALQIVLVGLCTALITFLARAYQNRLNELRRTSNDLARRTGELEASRNDLQRAQAVAKVGSWVYDIAADTMRLSAETCRIFGLPEGAKGSHDSYLALTHPQDRSALDSAWQKALTGAPFDYEHRIVLGTATRWVRQKAALEFAADGSARRAVGITQDITARKLAEEKLQLAASVFTHAREGIMITSADGTIIDVNHAFSRITGYRREEVVGHNPRLLSSGRQGKDYYTGMWRGLLEKGHWYGEVWNRRKNGEVYAEMQTISAVRDAQGNVRQYVALFSDITSQKEYQNQLEHIAHYDALTTLPNRLLLADRLHQAMAQAERREQKLAVAYLDLDGFKAVNDQHGHETGDQLLIALAARMKDTLREGDTLARLGGDEFVAILPDLTDSAASVPMLNRLLAAAAQPVQIGDLVLQVSASVGVTFFPQAGATDAEQLLRQADQAMYQAKQGGKNRYHAFDADGQRQTGKVNPVL